MGWGGVAHHLQERGEGPHCLNCTPIICAIYVNARKLKHIISPKFTPIGNTVWESGRLHVTHTVYITHNRIARCNVGVCILCMCHVLACVYLGYNAANVGTGVWWVGGVAESL